MTYRVDICVPVQAEAGVDLRVDARSPHPFASIDEALRWTDIYREQWRSSLRPGEPRLVGIVYDDEGKHRCGLGYGIEDTTGNRFRKYHGRLFTADELTEFWFSRGTTIYPFEPSASSSDVTETHDMTDRDSSDGRFR